MSDYTLVPTVSLASPRRCGSCTACCTVLGVVALAKPEHTPCVHARGHGGCGVYASRPAECSAYACAWLSGSVNLPAEDRPDRVGIIFDAAPALDGGKAIVVAREVRVGAYLGSRASRILRAIEAQTVVVRASLDGTRAMTGPASRVAALVRLSSETGKRLPQ